MNSAAQVIPNRPRARWPLRWWLAVVLMFAFQLTLIFWLSDQTVPARREPGLAPAIQLAGPGSAEVMALLDPTLFALPHRRGFSGRAWLQASPEPYRTFSWEDQPAWLALPFQNLGAAFQEYVSSNSVSMPLSARIPAPSPSLPQLCEPEVFAKESTFEVAGELARRRMLNSPGLCSWTNSEPLTNSVVQLLVNAQGRPVSVALLAPGCGLQQADAYALAQARATRFEALPDSDSPGAGNPLTQLAWGQLIFHWHTVPKPLTNTPSSQ